MSDQLELDFTVDSKEFNEAGLWEPGSYHFRIETMVPTVRTSKAGDKYNVLVARLIAFEQAEYDEEGQYSGIASLDPPKSRFEDFPVSGNGLAKLKSAYKTVTGRLPSGELDPETGKYKINLLQIADELVGSKLWNVVFHSKPDEQGAVYDRLTYTFASKPRAKFQTK